MSTTNLVTRKIAGETVIVPVRAGVGDLNSIYTLNETGTSIWEMVEAGASVHQIADRLCREYEVDPAEAAKDTAEFLDSLQSARLIQAPLGGMV
jgi:hypothetical protein